jgi:hypothetical protein
MPLRNHWNPFNLRSTPFFQDTLRSGSDARYPIALFVGREKEAQHLLAELGSAPDSRQVVVGAPGFGKTTLVQYVKHEAAGAGIYSYPDPVSLKSLDSADELLLRILGYTYDTLYSSGGSRLRASEAMATAKQLVLAFRFARVGANLSVFGSGGGAQVERVYQQSSFVSPFMVVPKLLRELIVTARRHEKRFAGLLVHMNNVENLPKGESAQAGALIRDLRDVFLMDGYHYVLVATQEAARDIIAGHAQVRSVFMLHEPLAPLSFAAFTRLLSSRYEHLKLDKSKPVRLPVEPTALRDLHQVFAGDLRGLLRSVNYAANQLLGYLGERGAAPMTARLLRAVLQPYYSSEITAHLSESGAEHFRRLQELSNATFSQADLAALWKVGQSAVSKILDEMRYFAYIREVSRERRKISFQLTGTARLALGVKPL